MTTTINLTAQAETRKQMTFASLVFDGRVLEDETGCFIGDTEEVANAAGIVATHSAAPALIEVARAAKELQNAHDSHGMISPEGTSALKALYDCLAKVSL